MKFEWDDHKRVGNLQKHGVEFADVVGVLDDPRALTLEDASHDEQRFITVGVDGLGRLLVVVYTYRGVRSASSQLERRPDRSSVSMGRGYEA